MRRSTAVVAAAVALALTGCAREVAGTAAAPADVRPWSAEEQIRDLVTAFEAAWNDEDHDGLRALMCSEMSEQMAFTDEALDEAYAETGDLDLTIVELEVDEDTAASIIENHGADEDDIAFTLENDEWKWCEF